MVFLMLKLVELLKQFSVDMVINVDHTMNYLQMIKSPWNTSPLSYFKGWYICNVA